jgi:hypothetical protein
MGKALKKFTRESLRLGHVPGKGGSEAKGFGGAGLAESFLFPLH